MSWEVIGALGCGFGLGALTTMFLAFRWWRWAWKKRRALISKLTWRGRR